MELDFYISDRESAFYIVFCDVFYSEVETENWL